MFKGTYIVLTFIFFNTQANFFEKIYSYFLRNNTLKNEYSYNDLPHELLLKIINKCDKKTWLTLRECSERFYNLCSDKSLKHTLQNFVKRGLTKHFIIEYEMHLDIKGFVTTSEKVHVKRTFDNLHEILKNYLAQNKKWINDKKLHKIHYYFIVYFVHDYILHNKQLDYIKIKMFCGKIK